MSNMYLDLTLIKLNGKLYFVGKQLLNDPSTY